MLILFFISVIVLSFIVWRWQNRKLMRLSAQLPCNLWCPPVIGHGYLFMGTGEDRMKAFQMLGRIALDSGGLTSLWIGTQLYVVATDPQELELIMKSCLAKDGVMNIAQDLFGNGSIFAPVSIWRRRRKVIAPTFSLKNLNRFMEVFSEQSSVMIEQLNSAVGRGTFSLWKYLTTYTMDSVCKTTLGVSVNAQRNPHHPFLEAFEQFCIITSALLTKLPIAQKLYKYLPVHDLYMKHIHCMTGFVDQIIKKKREEIAENKIKGHINEEDWKTFLELFIESSGGVSGFTDLELREEALVLVLAGTDTSAVGAAFTCQMLARHPAVQHRVYEEIKEVFGDSKRPISTEDLPRLKYLEIVIKESLRLYPPVPVIIRKLSKDFTLPSGVELVKDTTVMINIWAVHRNQEYWGGDADAFRPERFLEGDLKHPAAFMPFSYGPRSCLGYQYAMMSMKTAIATMIRHYTIRTAEDVKDPHAPLRVKFDVMMKHVDNFELQLEPRH